MKIENMYKVTVRVTAECTSAEQADDFEGALCELAKDFEDDRFEVFAPDDQPAFDKISYPARIIFDVVTVIEHNGQLNLLKLGLGDVCANYNAQMEQHRNVINQVTHQGVPHIEIDENTKDAILDLGKEGFFFPQVRSAPDHECMIVDMALLRTIRTDVDVEDLLVLLKGFTDIPQHVLVLAPLIYLMWEV